LQQSIKSKTLVKTIHVVSSRKNNPHRCVSAGTDLLATGGSFDGTVKIWNVSDGSMVATLRGGSSNSIATCDVAKNLVAGGGNDKTCRVWDIRTQRMVHQLVGHTDKITCVKLLVGGQGIVTASKDRQIKVWDISRQTYRQTTNIVLNSTANSVDVANDTYTLVSGHTNASLRFWDIRTGEKNAEIEST
jgi:autophagy-related protein 16